MKKYAVTVMFAAIAFFFLAKMTERAAAQGKNAAAPPVVENEKTREHVKYLSSDKLEGRGTDYFLSRGESDRPRF
jgi:hypothetical protein